MSRSNIDIPLRVENEGENSPENTNLSIDFYGRAFDKTTIKNADCIDYINFRGLDDFSEEEIKSSTVFIEDNENGNRLYLLSDLKNILQAGYYARIADPRTKQDIIGQLPDVEEAVTKFESRAADYNASILNKNPHFIELLRIYVEEILHQRDGHRYADANRGDIDANKSPRLAKFYYTISLFTEEEKADFYSLFITNREAFHKATKEGILIDYPAKWTRTEENSEYYDWAVKDGSYKDNPHRNVVLGDAFFNPEAACMHSWGMDVMHLLLQYHIGTNQPCAPFFDESVNPFSAQMEESLRQRIEQETPRGSLEPEKGVSARQTVVNLATSLQNLVQDIKKHADALRERYKNDKTIETICHVIDLYIDLYPDAHQYKSVMKSIVGICKTALEENALENSPLDETLKEDALLLFHAFANYKVNSQIWQNITTMEEMVNAEQKRMVMNQIKNTQEENKQKGIGIGKQPHLEILSEQIEKSDNFVTLNDIFDDNSPYMNIPVNKEEGYSLHHYFRNPGMPHPKIIVGDERKIVEEILRKKNLSIHAALVMKRQDYIDKGREKHIKDFDTLIQEIADILNREVAPDDGGNENRFREIQGAIQNAYNDESTAYINNAFFCGHGIFKRTREDFLVRLEDNDNRYCYPRMLQQVLQKECLTPLLEQETELDDRRLQQNSGIRKVN